MRPVVHSDDIPIPSYHPLPELSEDEYSDNDRWSDGRSDYKELSPNHPSFNQNELIDLIRDLSLSKEASELLASRLNDKKMLHNGTQVTFYRTREKEFLSFFAHENDLVFCTDVSGLLLKMRLPQYFPNDWRLFIDSSKRSLKCVLLHNGNKYASIPIAHSTNMKENYETIASVMQKIKFDEHKWVICVDFKVVNFLLGQQGGFTKYPCFLCLWDSIARQHHWIRKEWPKREQLVVGESNVVNKPLVGRDKIILPPLHIKLGIMKQFIRAVSQDSPCFAYLQQKMSAISTEKLKAGIFDCPQIRQLINDSHFQQTMNDKERQAWLSFVLVIKNFLGSHKAENYVEIVNDMLQNLKELGCNMSIKVHYLHSHLDSFPENLGDMSEEQGERFHQDLQTMENRYQGRWDTHMMADYCWNLHRDCANTFYSRFSKKRSFICLTK